MKKLHYLCCPGAESWPTDRLLLLSIDVPRALPHLEAVAATIQTNGLLNAHKSSLAGVHVVCIRTGYDEGVPHPKEWDEQMTTIGKGILTGQLSTVDLTVSVWEAIELCLERAHRENDVDVEIPDEVAQVLLDGYPWGFGQPDGGAEDEGWDLWNSRVEVDDEGRLSAIMVGKYSDDDYSNYGVPLAALRHHLAINTPAEAQEQEYEIPLIWKVSGTATIKASSLAEAVAIAADPNGEYEFPGLLEADTIEGTEYVDLEDELITGHKEYRQQLLRPYTVFAEDYQDGNFFMRCLEAKNVGHAQQSVEKWYREENNQPPQDKGENIEPLVCIHAIVHGHHTNLF